nr:toprim domain-containing protein [Azomonas macrocytogenes]
MSVPEGLDLNGGAIPLAEPVEGILGLAEGLETALSAYRATGIATWSTVNAQLMKTFECPEGVHTVIIWADRDRSRTGEVAANVLKARLEANGISVIVLLPQLAIAAKAKGIDWNDVLVGQGILGFPPVRQLRSFIENRRSRSM